MKNKFKKAFIGGMSNKVYVVDYYMDYETHGLHAIFNNKEEAEKCAKIMTEKDADIDCHYTVYEEMIYSSLDEWEEEE